MTTLARGLTATSTIVDVSDEALNVARPFLVTIDSETMRVRGLEYVSGAATRWNVDRGIDSTQATHAGGATVTLGDGGVGGAGTSLSFDNTIDPPTDITSLVAMGGTVVGSEATLRGKDFYAQDTDPGAVGAGSVWKDTSELPAETWWRRNVTDDGWDADFAPRVVAVGDAPATTGMTALTSGSGAAFAGSGADATGEGSASIVGSVSTAGFGNALVGRNATAMGGGEARAVDVVTTATQTASAGFEVTSTNGTLSLVGRSNGGDGDGLRSLTLTGLPTTEGAPADEVWNNDGLLMLSGGAISIPAAAIGFPLGPGFVSDPPTQAEVQTIVDQIDLLQASLIAAGLLAP